MAGVHQHQSPAHNRAAEGHHDMIAQPHADEEGPVAEAEILAAEMSSDEQPLGSLGRRFNRRSPFYIGLTASAGVAVTYGMVRVLASLSSMLVLIGVALFLAIGLEPAASWFVNRGLRRWLATTLVFVLFRGAMGAFVAAAIPPLAQQAGDLIYQVCPIIFSKPRTTPRPLVGSMTDSISNSGSPTRSKVQADQPSTR
jgi:AI-2E family transporter